MKTHLSEHIPSLRVLLERTFSSQ